MRRAPRLFPSTDEERQSGHSCTETTTILLRYFSVSEKISKFKKSADALPFFSYSLNFSQSGYVARYNFFHLNYTTEAEKRFLVKVSKDEQIPRDGKAGT